MKKKTVISEAGQVLSVSSDDAPVESALLQAQTVEDVKAIMAKVSGAARNRISPFVAQAIDRIIGLD